MSKARTTNQIVGVYNLLSSANISGLELKDKIILLRVIRAMKKISADFADAMDLAISSLRPADYDKCEKAISKLRAMTKEEQEAAAGEEEYQLAIEKYLAYEKDIESCMAEDASKEHDVIPTDITEEVIENLVAQNNWDTQTSIAVLDFFLD